MMPVVPHFSSECLTDINFDEKESTWPNINREYLEKDNITIVIQINGKKRSLIQTQSSIEESVIIDQIKKDTTVQKYLINKKIKKTIYIRDKLINIII